jgi:hypothetical protein
MSTPERKRPRILTHGVNEDMNREETANLVGQLADQIESGERDVHLQPGFSAAQQSLAKLRHVEGFRLLSAIGLAFANNGDRTLARYGPVRQALEKLEPFDRPREASRLRLLADDLRRQP